MNNILAAIMTKISGSSLSADVGGRIFLDAAPDGTEFPYVVFFIVDSPKDRTFTEEFRNTLIQFSLFSISEGATEITTMYNHLSDLLDECSLSITSNTLLWCREQNLTTSIDEITTPSGTSKVKHWAVDYELRTYKS